MKLFDGWTRRRTWTRRRFLAVTGAAAVHTAAHGNLLAQTATAPQSQSTSAIAARVAAATMPPSGVITGGIVPLLESNTARPLKYSPENGDFVIRNGTEFFGRPLYGPNIDFRVDAGDLPEFSLYLPGHGGNLKIGIVNGYESKWAAEADTVVARYRPGRMIYEIEDTLLGTGMLRLELLTAGRGSGLLLRMETNSVPLGTLITWAYAGASGRKGNRSGDIGCEKQPVTEFFQVRPEECTDNQFEVSGATARLHSAACDLQFSFPDDSQVRVAEFLQWNQSPFPVSVGAALASPVLPILIGSLEMGDAPVYLTIQRVGKDQPPVPADAALAFEQRSREISAIAATLGMKTPDIFLNAAAPAIGIAADAIWDVAQECVMHGGVAWRVPLAGWRGPYSLDSLGNHDRARQHFSHWLAKQNTTPITTDDPARGPADPDTHLARKELLLHSNGDVSYSHYDMNMVFFDVLLRHLRWTGDMEFAREIWPSFKRHLAWEKRLFRRIYTTADGRQLPLYEAYAVIWASDNLQYNGGGATHSSAYNLFAFRFAAQLAKLLGEDAAPYQAEADLIGQSMEHLLWLPGQGTFAESKDLLGAQTVYNNPAGWTVYHTIDSEAVTPRQAWQMIADQMSKLRRVPVHGDGVPDGPWYMLACSDWLPYLWSLTLLVLAENIHMALAMWQAGMADDAYNLLKGNLLDTMFQGLTPGNFHMSSQLDVHRQEAQRDFGDPIGITSRALTEGLFGVQPNLVDGRIKIRPGFPSDWDHAAIHHKDFDFSWRRDGLTDTYEFTSRFPKAAPLHLVLRARTTSLPSVQSGNASVHCAFDESAVGAPAVNIHLAAAGSYKIVVYWHGDGPVAVPEKHSYETGEWLELPEGISLASIDDPQNCLKDGRVAVAGHHVVFANMQVNGCRWSLPIEFDFRQRWAETIQTPMLAAGAQTGPVDLSGVLVHQINDIFTRPYTAPRSQFCSLALPEQLIGGWANMDMTASIDDRGLRAAGGMLQTALGVPFITPAGESPNCLFLSNWELDQSKVKVALAGSASGIYLLLAGTTYPQCSRMEHAVVRVLYRDETSAQLSLRNPESWWPIEQDYLFDDYLFVGDAAALPRVDLRTGQTRVLDAAAFKGKGRQVPGGAATVYYLPLDPAKPLAALEIEVGLYGVLLALLAATLVRESS